MNLKLIILVAAVLGGSCILTAAEKNIGGPKGGRLLDAGEQKAEFFVTPERKVEIVYYDANLRPTSPGQQVASVTVEPASGRRTLEMEATKTGFVSKTALPESDAPYRVVVQLREKEGARPQNYRIDLNLENCGECSRAEYACTCGH